MYIIWEYLFYYGLINELPQEAASGDKDFLNQIQLSCECVKEISSLVLGPVPHSSGMSYLYGRYTTHSRHFAQMEADKSAAGHMY